MDPEDYWPLIWVNQTLSVELKTYITFFSLYSGRTYHRGMYFCAGATETQMRSASASCFE
jgi:hypothetical protein